MSRFSDVFGWLRGWIWAWWLVWTGSAFGEIRGPSRADVGSLVVLESVEEGDSGGVLARAWAWGCGSGAGSGPLEVEDGRRAVFAASRPGRCEILLFTVRFVEEPSRDREGPGRGPRRVSTRVDRHLVEVAAAPPDPGPNPNPTPNPTPEPSPNPGPNPTPEPEPSIPDSEDGNEGGDDDFERLERDLRGLTRRLAPGWGSVSGGVLRRELAANHRSVAASIARGAAGDGSRVDFLRPEWIVEATARGNRAVLSRAGDREAWLPWFAALRGRLNGWAFRGPADYRRVWVAIAEALEEGAAAGPPPEARGGVGN